MTIDEMKQHEWIVSWSGGKDSTATIILMHEHNIPIKKILHVRMMYDDTLPATLPVMTEFVDHSKSVFESWGYDVEIVPSYRTLTELANRCYKRSADPRRVGMHYGITTIMRGICNMTMVKQETIRKVEKRYSEDYHMIGYACDETDRITRLNDKNCSIMVELKIPEKDAFEICSKYGLLSPLYEEGITRDGCWFCPNVGKKERKKMKEDYPELVRKIYDLIEMCEYMNPEYLENYSKRNNWLKQYLEDRKDVNVVL